MPLKLGVNHCSNAEYHGDKEYVSSSVLKTILKDINEYKKYYIDGEPKPAFGNRAALEEGSLMHSMILEPHLVDSEYALFEGIIKRGKEWEDFKAGVPEGKVIISKGQMLKSKDLFAAYQKLPQAVKLIEGAEVEHTVCVELYGIKVKVRCDAIKPAEGIIADVKTTGYSSELDTFKQTCKNLSYDLSAALYCMACEQHYGRPFDFYFIVLSKSDRTCDVYKTSKETMEHGKHLVIEALSKLKKARESGIWSEHIIESKLANTENDYEVLEV